MRAWPQGTFVLGPIGSLVTPVGDRQGEIEILSDHYLVVKDGEIDRIAPELPADCAGMERVVLPDCTVTPGLIDCHTHAVFAGYRLAEYELRLRGATYGEIMAAGGGIVNTVESTRRAREEELTAIAAGYLRDFARRGVTTVEIKSGYGLDRDHELKCLRAARAAGRKVGLEVVTTFMGAHAVPREYAGRADDYVTFVVEDVLPAVASEGLAEFCDVFCEWGAFSGEQSRRVLTRARELGLKLKIHADELGPSGGAALAAELGVASAEHLLHTGERDLKAMVRSEVVAVALPGTSFHLKERAAPARRMLDLGGQVAAATDFNPGSCPVLDLRFIMNLCCSRLGLTPAETLWAVTSSAAKALDRAHDRGRIAPGFRADLAIWKTRDYRQLLAVIGDDLLLASYVGGRRIKLAEEC